MEVANGDASSSVMVCLTPTSSEWCKTDYPHLTLVYAGDLNDLKASDFSELAKDACTIAMLSRPTSVEVSGVDTFGPPEEQVDVLKFKTNSTLDSMRAIVSRWNKSEYSFSPHATIGPVGSAMMMPPESLPNRVCFDKVVVCWGEQRISFWLNPTQAH